MFHIFRNTPIGRETLLQSLYFCKTIGATIKIYVPTSKQFIMNFDGKAVKIGLDESYLTSPSTAFLHVSQLVVQEDIESTFFKPTTRSFSSVPIIPANFDFMCCPRCISDLSPKIGSKVRRIIKLAPFPVLITSPGYKEQRSIAILYGGSGSDVNALNLGFRIAKDSGLPVSVFTHSEKGRDRKCKKAIKVENLEGQRGSYVNTWHKFKNGRLEENLYDVPHDALVILGAYGHRRITDLIFPGKIGKIQSTMTNSMLIVGPNYTTNGNIERDWHRQ